MSGKNCGRKNCGNRNCGCRQKDSCCDAIEKNMGKYFLESAQVGDAEALNATFTDMGELIARTQLYEQFIVQENASVRAAFVALSDCKQCDSQCCIGAAEAIANSSIGYVNLAFQAVLSKGNPLIADPPVITLQQVMALISAGSAETINTILTVAGCNIDI